MRRTSAFSLPTMSGGRLAGAASQNQATPPMSLKPSSVNVGASLKAGTRSAEVTASPVTLPERTCSPGRAEGLDRQDHVVAQHRGHAFARAAERHVLKLHARLALDLLDDQMAERSRARRADAQRFSAAGRFTSANVLRLEPRWRQHIAVAGDHADMGEVAKRIVADVGIDRGARQQRAGATEQQGVAVGLGAGGLGLPIAPALPAMFST